MFIYKYINVHISKNVKLLNKLSLSINVIIVQLKTIPFVIGKMLRHGVVVITTAQLHSTKPELRFYAGSNPAYSVPEICDGEDL